MPKKETKEKTDKLTCGIVMPISAIDGCNEQHWIDIKEIIDDAVTNAGFSPNLVSYADDVGIIQKRIIQNLYENPIVVCDVSGKNPNVMFELGLRLAFDKPTIIIKDDKTSYSFDTSPIEHLEYPRDLRFTKIIEFKENLKDKIKATYEKSQKDTEYTTFLKHFGSFTVAKLDTQEVSKEDYIIAELQELKRTISRQEKYSRMYGQENIYYQSKYPSDEIINLDNAEDNVHQLAKYVHKELSKYSSSDRKNMSKNLKNEIKHTVLSKYPINNVDMKILDKIIETMA